MGMSQERMAIYLGISRALLAMVETGNRTLPVNAIIKLGQLEAVLNNLTANPTPSSLAEMQRQASEHRAVLNKLYASCTREIKAAQRQLAWMQDQYEGCMRSLQLVAYELAKLGNSEADQLQRVNMELHEQETLKKLQQCGPGAQGRLRHKINVLAYEADEALKIVF